MPDYGSDFSCIEDITPTLATVEGRDVVTQATGRRLLTPREFLFSDEDYGTAIRQLQNGAFSRTQFARLVENEVVKDERVEVEGVDVAETDGGENSVDVTLKLRDARGPFDFTLTISDLSVSQLQE